MIATNYRNAYKEVDTILSYLDEEEFSKIPSNVIEAIRGSMNEDYDYEIDEDVNLMEQPMLPETKATLFNIFRDYLSTPIQKEKILKMQAEDRRKIELKKQEKFKDKELFNNSNEYIENIKANEQVALSEVKEKSFVQKIIDKIKNFFSK